MKRTMRTAERKDYTIVNCYEDSSLRLYTLVSGTLHPYKHYKQQRQYLSEFISGVKNIKRPK